MQEVWEDTEVNLEGRNDSKVYRSLCSHLTPLSVKRKFEMKTRATAWERRRALVAELVDAEQEEGGTEEARCCELDAMQFDWRVESSRL